MKRFLVIVLSILYMASATGFNVAQHYCMGRLISSGLSDTGKDECATGCCDDDAAKKDCCKDEHKIIKTADHQSAKTSIEHKLAQCYFPPLLSYQWFAAPAAIRPVADAGRPNAPPCYWRTYPIYLSIRSLRI